MMFIGVLAIIIGFACFLTILLTATRPSQTKYIDNVHPPAILASTHWQKPWGDNEILSETEAAAFLGLNIKYMVELLELLMVPYSSGAYHEKCYLKNDLEMVKNRLDQSRKNGVWDL